MSAPRIMYDLRLSQAQRGRHKLMNHNDGAHRRVARAFPSVPSTIRYPLLRVGPTPIPLTACHELLFAKERIVDIIVVTEVIHNIDCHDERRIEMLIFGSLPLD